MLDILDDVNFFQKKHNTQKGKVSKLGISLLLLVIIFFSFLFFSKCHLDYWGVKSKYGASFLALYLSITIPPLLHLIFRNGFSWFIICILYALLIIFTQFSVDQRNWYMGKRGDGLGPIEEYAITNQFGLFENIVFCEILLILFLFIIYPKKSHHKPN